MVASYYTGTNCTGTFVGNIFYCSTGAGASQECAAPSNCGGSTYSYSASELANLASLLQSAVIYNLRVFAPICASASQAGTYVTYYAN